MIIENTVVNGGAKYYFIQKKAEKSTLLSQCAFSFDSWRNSSHHLPLTRLKWGYSCAIWLKHCVGSYIENVLDGETRIVFIRKAEDLDKPFFTVEVDNNNVIQQAHGFCNSNVNTVNGLMDFIDSWAKEKNLVIGRINQMR